MFDLATHRIKRRRKSRSKKFERKVRKKSSYSPSYQAPDWKKTEVSLRGSEDDNEMNQLVFSN